GQLNHLEADVIDFAVLKDSAVLKATTKTAKIVLSGKLERAVTVRGIPMTKGAKAAIEALGGKVE
ncbi:MAG TPA: uL15 family ribosomal protein, partial [Gammaproteobacteria bacterium]|nr:uL15 family ribosomal protein [Gammaproteobacteria bacterium]